MVNLLIIKLQLKDKQQTASNVAKRQLVLYIIFNYQRHKYTKFLISANIFLWNFKNI